MSFIFFDPHIELGTIREPSPGKKVMHVSPEQYCVHQLGFVTNVTVVFLNLGPNSPLPLERRLAVDEAVADAYWNRYKGLLLPPRVLRAIDKAARESKGDFFFQALEAARLSILDEEKELSESSKKHVEFRVNALRWGAERKLSDRQVAVLEVFSDLMLLQRASMDDMVRAEEERGEGPRADILVKLEKAGELSFERTLPLIIQTARVLEAIPHELRPALQEFAERRHPYYRDGIIYEKNAG